MSYPAYPEYQDSGVEWLDQKPSHWIAKRLRHVTDLNPGKSRVRGGDPEMETTFLPMEAVGEDGSLELAATRPLSDVIDGYTYFQEDDVTYAKITPCFENGKAAILRGLKNGIGFGTTELTVLRPHTDQTTRDYLFKVITSEPFRSLGESSMYGAGGQKRVPDDFARNFSIPWPPLQEQTQIARFLDHQTTRIDALIAEQQRLIELLKEKRQAVISHAVTKGLDPDVAMKDSGVEWLGKVPEHWEIKKLKHLTLKFEQGWSPQCENSPVQDNSEAGVLKVGCVNNGRFRRDENKRLPSELSLDPEITVKAGDLLISRANTRDLVGSAATPTVDHPNLMISDKLFRLTLDQNSAIPFFLASFLNTPFARRKIEPEATGTSSSMLNIGQSTIREMHVPCPPIEEQIAIRDEVVKRTWELMALTERALGLVDLLQERRSALISAAVTGKIDVRDWQPPALEIFPETSVREGATA